MSISSISTACDRAGESCAGIGLGESCVNGFGNVSISSMSVLCLLGFGDWIEERSTGKGSSNRLCAEIGCGWVGVSITRERDERLLSASNCGDSYCHMVGGGSVGMRVRSPSSWIGCVCVREYFGRTFTAVGCCAEARGGMGVGGFNGRVFGAALGELGECPVLALPFKAPAKYAETVGSIQTEEPTGCR